MSSSNRNRDDMSGALVRRDTPSAIEKSTSPIDFADHAQFHTTVARAVIGGSSAALLTEVASNLIGLEHATPAVLTIAVTTGVMAAIAARSKKWWRAALGGLFGATGASLSLVTGQWPLFAGALLGASAMPVLARGESWKRMAVVGAAAGAFGSAGLFVAEWMQN